MSHIRTADTTNYLTLIYVSNIYVHQTFGSGDANESGDSPIVHSSFPTD
jgi:hypothetical protein